MLAYAAHTRPAQRAGSPKLLTLVILGHVAAVGVLLTTKMVLDGPTRGDPTDVVFVPNKPPPPPPPQPVDDRVKDTQVRETVVTQPRHEVEIPTGTTILGNTGVEDNPIVEFGNTVGPIVADPPKPAPVRVAARFNTPESLLRPPYPLSKIRAEEEATLRLKLSIDERGRVVAVDPVGVVDPEFLAAARRHLIKAWRYKPATVDGVAAPSTIVITLSFRLESA